jgi:ABC-type multidrug transport system permease subunit
MRGLLAYAGMMLRLQFRSRLAVFYGFLFPLIFIVAFRILYRHEIGHGASHLGELLVVAILGGTCFGLPVTLVSERERGVWRRYRLLPTPIWTLVAGTMGVRFVLLAGAGALQLLAARAADMRALTLVPDPNQTAPTHLPDLLLAFAVVSFTFCSFGLIVAMVTNSVQAAQALGQCIFLPMLALGGIAVDLDKLPEWTQTLAAFTPGRYAVEALFACSAGEGLTTVRYELGVLLFMGVAAGVSAARMFRWDVHTGHERRGRIGWLAVTLAACLIVGFSTLRRDAAEAQRQQAERASREQAVPAPEPALQPAAAPAKAPPSEQKVYAVEKAASWDVLTPANLLELPRTLPPDTGVVTPIAANLDEIDDDTQARGKAIYAKLATWAPGKASDPLQRVANLLYVAAVVDVMQIAPLESYLPVLVEQHLWESSLTPDLVRQLAWIATHPLPGELLPAEDMEKLEIEVTTNRANEIESRMHIYAAKFMFRLLDDPNSGAIPKAPAAK